MAVQIERVQIEQAADIFSATIYLDNHEAYQLRVCPSSTGVVYTWVDHRPRFGSWKKLVELFDGKER